MSKLERPEFGVPAGRFAPPPKPWEWQRTVDYVRQYPGQTMIVARHTKGTRDQMRKAAWNDVTRLIRGLERRYPLEKWNVRTRLIPDTWYHRIVILRFCGTRSPEDLAKLRAKLARIARQKREYNKRKAIEVQLGQIRQLKEVPPDDDGAK